VKPDIALLRGSCRRGRSDEDIYKYERFTDDAEAWVRHDCGFDKRTTRSKRTCLVASTLPNVGIAEFTGIDKYMELKVKAAQLIEPLRLQELSSIGDAQRTDSDHFQNSHWGRRGRS
jgi:hypothetical protein